MKIVTETFCPDGLVPGCFLSGEDVLFDIETTGLNWRRSHLYLIGAAVFCPENGRWKLTQWFADEPARELDLLEAFAEFLRPYRRLLHYNGAGFDLPYLRKKYEFYQQETPFSGMDTLDLYRRFRPFQKMFGLSSMKQKSLEAYAGFSRTDHFSGEELIHVYEEYLVSGDKELLRLLHLHNREDLTGMTEILSLYSIPSLFSGHFQPVSAAVDRQIRTLSFSLTADLPFTRPFETAAGACSLSVSGQTASLRVLGQERELKFFFPDFKDYYYLPLEDTAIHKSVGIYVDPEHREKAKASNCYQRHYGLYFPQPSELVTPVFREDHKARQLYFEWQDSLAEDPDFLSRYASAVLSDLCRQETS